MASTYSTNLKIELMGTGENSGTWGTITNTNLGTAFEQAVIGLGNPDYTSDANLTITLTNSNAAQAARALVLNVTSAFGSLTATRELIVPTIQKQYIVQNNTTGGQSITVKTSGGTGITVPNGRKAHLYVDGTNVIQMFDFVDINGGAIDGTAIGATSASTGAFTSLTASGATTLNGAVALGDASGDLVTVPGTVNSNLLFTDATYDIGASGATRPRDMFLSRNLTVGGTLTLAGGVNLNGNVTVGDSSADTLTINSTITSNLIFTDNTYDIGASGATRPRNLFLAGNATIGGAQTLTGALTVDSTTDSSSTTTGSIQTDGGVGIAKALFVGTTANIAGALTVNTTALVSSGTNNIGINTASPLTNGATYGTLTINGSNGGAIQFASAGVSIAQVYNDGNALFINPATGKTLSLQIAGSTVASVGSTGLAVTGALSATSTIKSDDGTNGTFQIGALATNLIQGGSSYAGITYRVPTGSAHNFTVNNVNVISIPSTGLAVTGALSATTTLGVTGATTLSSTLAVVNNVTIGDATLNTPRVLLLNANATSAGNYGTIRFGNTQNLNNNASIVGSVDVNIDDGKLTFNTAPTGGSITERVRIKSTGEFLVGTTSTTSGGKLVVNGTTYQFQTANGTTATPVVSGGYLIGPDDPNVYAGIRAVNAYLSSNASQLAFYVNGATGNAFEAGRFDMSGRLLVGAPTSTGSNSILQVYGGAEFFGSQGTNAVLSTISFWNTNSSGSLNAKIEAYTGANIYEGQLVFSTKDVGGTMAERARINSAGNLLVGSTSTTGSTTNYAIALAGAFKSFGGSVSTTSGTAATLFTAPTGFSSYLITVWIGADDVANYQLVAIVSTQPGSSAKITTIVSASLLAVSLSGYNVQATQSSGGAATINYHAIRIAV